MKIIETSKGEEIFIDDEVFVQLSKYKWHVFKNETTPTPYAKRTAWVNGKSKSVLMHRFITKCPDNLEVDHKDGYGLNNQSSNLRVCTILQNRKNRRLQSNSSNNFIGIQKQGRKFSARIWTEGRQIHLGTFETEMEAAKAYDKIALKLRGEYACLNFTTGLKQVPDEK